MRSPYDYYRYPYDGLLHLLKETGWELETLYNRGHSYAMLGQLFQHVSPRVFQPRLIVRALNAFFLWCDRRRQNDAVTMGWTAVARPVSP